MPTLVLERESEHREGSSDSAARGWVSEKTALFVLLVVLYALVGRGTFYTSDEGGIYNTTLAIIQHGNLALPGPYENAHLGRNNHYYACREILPTLAVFPFYASGLLLELFVRPGPTPAPSMESQLEVYQNLIFNSNWPIFLTVTFLGPIMVATTLLFLYAFVRREGVSQSDALWLTLAAGWTTPLAVYAKTIFPQVFEAALLMLAFNYARHWRETGVVRFGWRLGLVSGLGLMTRAAFAPVTLWFLGYLAWTGPATRANRLKAMALALPPLFLGAAVTGYVNWLRWGSPSDFGYHHPYETFSTPLWTGIYGLLASPGKGLLVFAPVLLLTLVFGRCLWERGRQEVVLALGITATYLSTYGCWYDWGGGLAWGPRFLLPLIAPWIALSGRAFLGASARSARLWLTVLCPVGFVFQLCGVLVWPHWLNLIQPDPFSLSQSHITLTMQTLLRRGPDDLWLWSKTAALTPAYPVLVCGLGVVAVWALWMVVRYAKERPWLAQ